MLTVDINYKDAWDPSKHPRGQPENAGEFAPKSGGVSSGGKPSHEQLVEAVKSSEFSHEMALKVAKGADGYETDVLFRALGALKPAAMNKKDREYRKLLLDELAMRGYGKKYLASMVLLSAEKFKKPLPKLTNAEVNNAKIPPALVEAANGTPSKPAFNYGKQLNAAKKAGADYLEGIDDFDGSAGFLEGLPEGQMPVEDVLATLAKSPLDKMKGLALVEKIEQSPEGVELLHKLVSAATLKEYGKGKELPDESEVGSDGKYPWPTKLLGKPYVQVLEDEHPSLKKAASLAKSWIAKGSVDSTMLSWVMSELDKSPSVSHEDLINDLAQLIKNKLPAKKPAKPAPQAAVPAKKPAKPDTSPAKPAPQAAASAAVPKLPLYGKTEGTKLLPTGPDEVDGQQVVKLPPPPSNFYGQAAYAEKVVESLGLGENVADYAQKIPPTTKDNLHIYTGNGYTEINTALRGGVPLSDYYQEVVNSLDHFFDTDTAKLKNPVQLWRGIKKLSNDQWSAIKSAVDSGKTAALYNPAYSSNSVSRHVASSFAGEQGMLMRVTVAAGTPALYASCCVNPAEQEVILPRSVPYRVTGMEKMPDGRYMLEVMVHPK